MMNQSRENILLSHFFQIHLRQHKTSVVRQIWPSPTLWPAAGTPGCRRPTCPPSTPSIQRYGNLQSVKTPSNRNAWKQSKLAQLCGSTMTIMSFQGFKRKEPLLRASTRSPPLHDTSLWLYPVPWDENMCEGGEWAGRSNLSANRFRTPQCRWSMQSLIRIYVSPFITETKEFYHSFFKASIRYFFGLLSTLKSSSVTNINSLQWIMNVKEEKLFQKHGKACFLSWLILII